MLIALSGGADSVALLLHLQQTGEAKAAAHCNFHLRGAESDRDERFVRQLCEERGIPLFVKHFDTYAEAEATHESIEMVARRLRYEWFDHLCREHHFKAVAVAHHMEDNAETILLNLVRGTGLRGLCGISAERDNVVRPLLGWTKQQILDFLAERNQPYMTDSTNADTCYRRNFIRHRLLPLLHELNPKVEEKLNEMARHLQQTERIYQRGLQQAEAELLHKQPYGWSIPFKALAEREEAPTLLHEWLGQYGFTAQQAESALGMKVGAIVWNNSHTHLCTRTRDALQFGPLPTPYAIQFPDAGEGQFQLPDERTFTYRLLNRADLIDIPRDAQKVALDADTLIGHLSLRPTAEADRFRPFGMKGTKLVSDFLTDRHFSRLEKFTTSVLTDERGIVWLVGQRIDQRVAITSATQRVLLLQIR